MQMNLIFLLLVAGCALIFPGNSTVFHVPNASVDVTGANSEIVYGTCQQCLCQYAINRRNITSFNCFTHNNTCQLFSASLETSSITIRNHSDSVFYFFPFSTASATASTDTVIQTTINVSSGNIMTSAHAQTSTVSATSSTQLVNSTTPSTLVPSTTLGPFSFTYLNLNCSALPTSFIAYNGQNAPTTATIIRRNYTATSNIATLTFGIKTNNQRGWYIDDVRVVLINNRSHSLLINGDFEYGNLTGWNAQNCTFGCQDGGQISRDSSCNGTYCYHVPEKCGDYQFLQQAFPTTPNQQYEVSFLIYATRSGGSNGLDARVSIL